jgi:hypothetical protein
LNDGKRAPDFAYSRKQDYWQTEGNFDFLGILSRPRRAAWRVQFFTRAFAAGIRKVVVMDASRPEQIAVRAYLRALPDPFPMRPAGDRITVLSGRPIAYCHLDSNATNAGRVWVLWATADSGPADLEIPCLRDQAKLIQVDGAETMLTRTNDHLRIHLQGDRKMAPPVLLIDRLAPSQ